MGASAAERREELIALYREVQACQKCPLHATRTQVVFGSGNADADLMFVGEAPGFHEDQQGKPFVGAAGKLLEKLLADIGLNREDVFIANVLKSRPPGNRDPQLEEIEACKPYLTRQIQLIEPLVICTLGNFSTKLLTRRQDGITRVHGKPQQHTVGGLELTIYPIYHPAAGLRSQAMLTTLREDFERLPELLAAARPEPEPEPEPAAGGSAEPIAASQLGLFG
jgi:uracil-DNA glycosylase family 4